MRPLHVILVGSGLLALFALGVWYFAYAIAPGQPSRVYISGLDRQATVNVHEDGVVAISGASDLDRYRALGFAQGSVRTWVSLLLRQTAVAGLSRWFGQQGVAFDGHVARLRIEDRARAAYLALDESSRARLDAFADGMNTALLDANISRIDPLVALRVQPQRWHPWHTLAVEQLFAWLATDVEPDSLSTTADRFLSIRRLLREQLGLNGFDRSAAWAFRREDVTYVHYRLVHGRSALPYFLDVSFADGDEVPTAGIALAGTPFLIAGRSDSRMWVLLPDTDVRIDQYDGPWRLARARLEVKLGNVSRSGDYTREPEFDERIVSFAVDPAGALLFAVDSSTADSTSADTSDASTARAVRIDWPGFAPATDAAAFAALQNDGSPDFRLLDGTALYVSRTGLWSTESSPEWNNRFSGGVLLENSPWTPFHIERLDFLIRNSDSLSTAGWASDTFSPWAAGIVPLLLDVVDSTTVASRTAENAVTYLRNWDFDFASSSIAASITDAWATRQQTRTGVFPTASSVASDTTFSRSAPSSLRHAVEALQTQHGADLSTWRWERTQETTRRYPLASWFTGPMDWISEARFAHRRPLGGGHPSSLAWGARSDSTEDPPGAWNVVLQTDRWHDWLIRRNQPTNAGVRSFGEALGEFEDSSGRIPSDSPVVRSTTLIPANDRR